MKSTFKTPDRIDPSGSYNGTWWVVFDGMLSSPQINNKSFLFFQLNTFYTSATTFLERKHLSLWSTKTDCKKRVFFPKVFLWKLVYVIFPIECSGKHMARNNFRKSAQLMNLFFFVLAATMIGVNPYVRILSATRTEYKLHTLNKNIAHPTSRRCSANGIRWRSVATDNSYRNLFK